MVAAWASVASAACPPERPGARTVLLVLARDPALDRHAADVERAVRRAAAERLALLGTEATTRALSIEGGADERERAVVEARVVLARAEDRFRELDDEEALGLIAKVTTKLGSVHQEPDAIAMLTRAHLLAGAIFLARGRIDAARQRLQRALDLDPALSPPRDRFAPEVLAELAAVRASAALRPVGRLEVRTSTPGADVFVDGHAIGATPLVIDAVPAGNHLLRISAPGRTSHVETIAIAPEAPRIVAVELADDPELGAIAGLRAALARDEDPKSVLALVARRAGADEAMLASFALSPELSATGTATIGVALELSSRGRAWSPSLDRAALGRALDAARRCDEEGLG
ncbi:PEGA domain-containing protein, partial [Myxococcota bacterium]|nr:PEGA domain-containing protein [Myxococcota bacterium]